MSGYSNRSKMLIATVALLAALCYLLGGSPAAASKAGLAAAPTLPISAGKTLYTSSFGNAAALGDYDFVNIGTGLEVDYPASWRLDDGLLRLDGTASLANGYFDTLALPRLAGGSNYRVEAVALGSQAAGSFGLVARYSSAGYYRLTRGAANLNQASWQLDRYDAAKGDYTLLARASQLTDGYTRNAWTTLGLEVQGDNLRVFVDGQQVGQVRDASYSGGRGGLISQASSGLRFASLRLTSPSGSAAGDSVSQQTSEMRPANFGGATDISLTGPSQYPFAAGRQNILTTWTTGNVTGGIGSARSLDSGASWNSQAAIPGGNSTNYRPALAVSPDGATGYAVWADTGSTGNIKLVKYTFATATWNGSTFVTSYSGRTTNSPGIAVKPDGSIHVFYTLREDSGSTVAGRIYYRVSYDGGASWQNGPDWLPQGDTSSLSQASVATVDTAGRLHVVWMRYGLTINTADQSSNGSWTFGERRNGRTYWPFIAAANNGDVGIVWQENANGQAEIYYERWTASSGTWPATATNASNTGDTSTVPALSFNGGQARVAWVEGDTVKDIYYSEENFGSRTVLVSNGVRHDLPFLLSVCGADHIFYMGEEVSNFHIYVRNQGVGDCGTAATSTPQPTSTPGPTFTPAPCGTFTDVPSSNIFYNDIVFLACRSAISGFANGDGSFRFEPNSPTNRGQFAKIAAVGFGLPPFSTNIPTFVDVPTSSPFFGYIETAVHAGAINGLSAAQCTALGQQGACYAPNLNITRVQVAIIVQRIRNYGVFTPVSPSFIDLPVGSFGYEAVETLVGRGIISGATCSGGAGNCFRPNDGIKRGELSKVVRRAFEAVPLR